jgi:hypothetical protein
MKVTTIGIDLAKAVFQIHGVDERGKVAVRITGQGSWKDTGIRSN